MGLSYRSTGLSAVDSGLWIQKRKESDRVIALAGNPNVGKSTIFNGLTGMNQHTGNWPGKTVSCAQGYFEWEQKGYIFVDIPGTYSLLAHSAEEEVARNFICFQDPDGVVVVCDATCLERNLNLVLQIMEITGRVIVCVNLMDEAARKGLSVDLKKLEERLQVPVVGTIGQKTESRHELAKALAFFENRDAKAPLTLRYSEPVEKALAQLEPVVALAVKGKMNSRFVALRLLDPDESLFSELKAYLGEDLFNNPLIQKALWDAKETLKQAGISRTDLRDQIVSSLVTTAERYCEGVVTVQKEGGAKRDRKIDRFLTGRKTGYPVMLLLLLLIFWLTISGANLPSSLLSKGLFWIEGRLSELFYALGAPNWLHDVCVLGIYRVLSWVVSAMLPPMAIFFPLFTLLEDVGYLPRVAYNLDHAFQRCHACGKQSLSMCMGFGCNAAGVVGARIIDSPRERLIAILTNNFVPCNGRFPTIISILTMFFVAAGSGIFSTLWSALLLTGVIILGIFFTFLVSAFLSKTLLKGEASSFTLELPPYRRPQVGKIIVRSLLDRTLFVLGRAVAVAAPAGLLIWILANVSVGGDTLLSHIAAFLDPFAQLLGLDGVILIAFLLGLPANEIVLPLIIMAYLADGSLTEMESIWEMKALFVANGWTAVTAINVILFSLFHWPCSTTLITIYKETKSVKWTLLSFFLPTGIGMLCCACINGVAGFFQ